MAPRCISAGSCCCFVLVRAKSRSFAGPVGNRGAEEQGWPGEGDGHEVGAEGKLVWKGP